jgi:HSP20 family protein
MFGLIPWRKQGNGLEARRSGDPLSLFRSEFDSLFDRFFRGWTGPEMKGVELEETDKEMLMRMDAPGFEAKDFAIHVTGDTVKVVAEHREGEDGKKAHRRLEEYVTLPVPTDPEKVEASYRNGVLELKFAKTEAALGKRIEVKGA